MKLYFFILFFLISFSSLIYAAPELPMIISGKVYINNKLADIGTEITAKVDNKDVENFKVSKKGEFYLLLQKLEKDSEVKFYVDNIITDTKVNYKSGDFQNLELNIKKSNLIYKFGLLAALIIITIILIIWKLKKK